MTFDGETRDVYRKGEGTGVIVIHEMPGIEPDVLDFAEEIVARGHTVWLPHLFGTPGGGLTAGNMLGDIAQFCVRREFSVFATGRTSPVAGWLRALARALHAEAGGPGVGVVGMCFTGGFALAMMTDAPVIAPVLAEPSLPAALGLPAAARRRGASLGLSPADLANVKASSCEVLGLRYRADPAVAGRFATLERELGDRFVAIEFEGRGHSVLTAHRRETGVRRVLDFFDAKLDGRVADRTRDTAAEERVSAAFPDVVEVVITTEPLVVEVVVARRLSKDDYARLSAGVRDIAGAKPDIRFDRSRAVPRAG
jgi:dienelactone hydrolase